MLGVDTTSIHVVVATRQERPGLSGDAAGKVTSLLYRNHMRD